MKSVNYLVLGEIFSLLERIELIHEVDFAKFDPDDEKDVNTISENYVKPTVIQASGASQEALRLAIAYYTTFETAPIQLMKDRCQELTLPDANSWNLFFNRIGAALFGDEFKLEFDPATVTQRLDEQESESLFRRR